MKVLLCRPEYFDVPEFDPQNKHMDPGNRPDLQKALAQHQNLAQVYKDFGLEVLFIDPSSGLVDMTFTANLGLVADRKMILSNFTPVRRRGKTDHYEAFLQVLGYETHRLPENVFFEGAGDAIPYKDKILCGYGFRTSKEEMGKSDLYNVSKHNVVKSYIA